MRDMSLKRAIQNWNMKYVATVRSPGSAIRVFTSSERLANHLKINETVEFGKIGEEERDGCSENWKMGEEERDGWFKVWKMEQLGTGEKDRDGRFGKLVMQNGCPKC